MLIAIDPGPEQSAYVLYDTVNGTPAAFEKVPNQLLLDTLEPLVEQDGNTAAIEMIASYGMPVGAEVFETCLWIGRYAETFARLGVPVRFVYRKDVKVHLCGSVRAKDGNVRQALIDRYGPGKELAVGRKATPGPLYGVSGDVWAALAVAVTDTETHARRAA